MVICEDDIVVGQLNLEDDDDAHDNSTENANQNEGNVGQVLDLFDDLRDPEFDTTFVSLGINILLYHCYELVLCNFVV